VNGTVQPSCADEPLRIYSVHVGYSQSHIPLQLHENKSPTALHQIPHISDYDITKTNKGLVPLLYIISQNIPLFCQL